MAVALLVKLLKRSGRYVLLLVFVSTLALFLTFVALPRAGLFEEDRTFVVNDILPVPTQPMWDAKLPFNSSELERKAAIFLRKYDDECRKKTAELEKTETEPLCPCVPDGLLGPIQPNTAVTPWSALAAKHPELTKGGRWQPANCTARQRVVVVVPYRDRDEHLRILLQNLHPVLQRQQLEYRILVVEQAFPHIFNKAALMNIGFRMAMKLTNFDCVVFHDVDMLPADDRQPYTCFHQPTHMGAYLDKFSFGKSYVPMFGGVTSFTRADYVRVNGFSNLFWGWGGEDDDMRKRIAAAKFSIYRYPLEVSRYRMLHHGRDHRNPVNPFRAIAYRYRPLEYIRDGLSNIKYRVHSHEERPLYTWLLVEPVSSISNYTFVNGTCKGYTMYAVRVPIQRCAELCDANEHCRAFVYDSHVWCLLKRRPCRQVLPSQSQRLYVTKNNESQHDRNQNGDALSKYRRRSGDCSGGDISGHEGVGNATACAEKCDKLVECVGFVYTTRKSACYLKLVSCDKPSPKAGATMYDIIDEDMPPMQALEADVTSTGTTKPPVQQQLT